MDLNYFQRYAEQESIKNGTTQVDIDDFAKSNATY